jgi:8-oxo-dGTP pyrophosphatase MutT (NUDIX family)
VSDWAWRRRAARVIPLSRDGRVLLLRASDPLGPLDEWWWEIPGGGIDHGETSADAARRELYEETGITAVEIGPCVWVQRNRFSFAGYRFDQHERIHVAWCDDLEVRPAALEALEAAAFDGHKWWEIDELLASDVRVLPPGLREHIADLVAGRLPETPVDIGDLPLEDEWVHRVTGV